MSYYAVAVGKQPGIYSTWDECSAQVTGFSGARHKKFKSRDQAEAFLLVQQSVPKEKPLEQQDAAIFHRLKVIPFESTFLADKCVVYTDGSCLSNGRAGIGVWFGHNDPRNLAERLPGHPTNQRAEIYAAIRALETLALDPLPIEVRTDSKYVINAVTDWRKSWRTAPPQGAVSTLYTKLNKQVENSDLFVRLFQLVDAKGNVQWTHVKGHSGEVGNEAADRLAARGGQQETNTSHDDQKSK
jgi:ribonuclease HI